MNDTHIEGYDVIEETVSLLHGLEFSAQEGTTVSGEFVRLVIAPQWNGVDAYRLLLTCFVYGDRKVDWANMPVRLSSIGGTSAPVFVFRVNPRGQAIINGVPPGEYRMSVKMTYSGGGDIPVILPQDEFERLAASSEQNHDKWPEPLMTLVSNDARLLAVPQSDAHGHLSITFESRDKSLAYGSVRFAVIDAAGEVILSHELVLEKSEHPGVWMAKWYGDLDIKSPASLVFDAVPVVSVVDD